MKNKQETRLSIQDVKTKTYTTATIPKKYIDTLRRGAKKRGISLSTLLKELIDESKAQGLL